MIPSCRHSFVIVDHVVKGQKDSTRPIDGVRVVCVSGGGVRDIWPDGLVELIKTCQNPIDAE